MFTPPPVMKSFLLLLCPLLLVSCAQQSLTGDAYTRSQAGQAQTIQTGRITSIRPVRIEGGTRGGSLLGSVAGGFLGREVGHGAGRTAATIGGSILGGAVGSRAQKGLAGRQGLEMEIALDGGKTLSVVQEVNPREPFAVGDRVRVLSGRGGTKVTH